MQVAPYLDAKRVLYRRLRHVPTASAKGLAQAIQAPGDMVCKSVVIFADRLPILLVLPATKRIDFGALTQYLGTFRIRLAQESEFARLFPDCETGAIPPFGSQYDVRTIVDASLADCHEIIFEGNHHQEAYRIHCRDFLTVERPEVTLFAC